jgi:crotonobetainyl-CoA:carnitine CoA-transferase CaiB-like acyl-CoA transferase
MKVGPGVGDTIPGLYLAIGVLSAVMNARQTGRGQFVDVAMLDCVLAVSERIIHQHFMGGTVPGPEGGHHPFITPFGIFPAKDGHIALACTGEGFFEAAAQALDALELLEDPITADAAARGANRPDAIARIGAVTARFTKAELLARLGGRAPMGPVYDAAEIAHDPHFAARGMLQSFDLPDLDVPMVVAGSPIKLNETPGGVRAPGPRLGEHTRAALAEAGVSAAQIEAWFASGAIGGGESA